jgi:hypothetical protein
MTLVEKSKLREDRRQQVLRDWAQSHHIDLDRLDSGQQWVIYAALQAQAVVGSVRPLGRVLTFLLAHCGMDLGSQVIAAVVQTSDRTVRNTQLLTAEQLLQGIRQPPGGNRPPKLLPEHVGPVAKYLFLHPEAQAPAVLDYIKGTCHVQMERHALHHYMLRYGLGELKDDQIQQPPPFWAPPPMAVPSCC